MNLPPRHRFVSSAASARLVCLGAAALGFAFACGGAPTKAPDAPVASASVSSATVPTAAPAAPAPSASATAAADGAPAGMSKREAHVFHSLQDAKTEADEETRGRKAMLGLARTEKAHLPASVVKLLELGADSTTKAADFNAQVMDLVGKPPLSEGLEDLCGRPAGTVLGDLQKADAKKRMEKLYADCKLGRRIKTVEADLPRLNAASVLLALTAREFLAKHDALVEAHEELIKLALFTFVQKK